MTPIPLSLYIHIPWCIKKCPYCDFNSHEAKTDPLINPQENDYIHALIADLESELPHSWGRPVDTIFIGGGTPSLFSATAYDTLLSAIRARLTLRPNAEITLEANPATFEQEKFAGYREAGINRLSIGCQSFNNTHLKSLGRVHAANEAIRAAHAAKAAGFDNLNLDIMFGLPQQTHEQGLEDLQQAIDLKPTHLSWYQLTIEENTLFYHQPPTLPDDDKLWELQQTGQTLLTKYDYKQYEISAYSKPRHQCQHNLNYWQFGDYIGIGAGAHGKLSFPDNTIHRYTKYRHPRDYLKQAITGNVRSSEKTLSKEDCRFEFMLNALRLNQGFDINLFEDRVFQPIDVIQSTIDNAISDRLLIQDNRTIETTALGKQHLNTLIERFL